MNARILWFSAAVVFLVGCRCKTRYEPVVTEQCRLSAAADLNAKRDGGAFDLSEHKRLCEECCRARGFASVDPGPCECGELGIDVLLK